MLRARLADYIPEANIRPEIEDFGGTKFDVISAFGVLEHVYSPSDLVAAFHAQLNPGGKVIITAPNPCSFQRYLAGASWWNWLGPRHMYLMRMDAIVEIFERHRFQIVEQKHFFVRDCSATLVLSFLPGLNPLNISGLKLVTFGLLLCAATPFEWLASLFGRGGFMGLVAVKKDKRIV